MKNQNLASGQRKIQVGTLRHNSDQVLDSGLFFPHVVLANPGLARRWPHPGGQDTDRGGFARAVGAKQAENLSRKNFQRKPVERRNLDLRLLPAFRIGARNKASGSAQWRRGVIDLAQVLSTNANSHAEQSPIWEKLRFGKYIGNSCE